jgi:hypothetical protein
MKKLSIFTLSIICCTFCYAEGILMHNGKTYSVDTLSYSHIIGPSTRYACYRLPDYPMVIYLTEVDLTNPHIELEGCLGKDKAFGEECPTEMAARHNTPGHEVIAVTNGDFYFYQSYDYLSYGIPRSGQFINNECVTNPVGRACFVLDSNNKPHIDRIDFSGTITKGTDKQRLHSLNMLRLEWESEEINANMLTLYTNAFGAQTTNTAGGTYAIIRPKSGNFFFSANKDIACIVESITSYNGATVIPEGKALLHGRGTSSTYLTGLTIGDEVTIRLTTNLRTEPGIITDFKETMGGSNNIVLRNGEIALTPEEGTETGVHPRTGMGFSKDSTKVYLMVIDGRQGHSSGTQLDDFGAIFRYFGSWNAVNLDGGGSSIMAINGTTMNKPSDGRERAVGNGMLVISNAPADDTIKWLEFQEGPFNLPMFASFTPKVLGFNQYGVLKNADLKGFKLTCTPNLGRIENDTTLIVGNTPCVGTLTATYNGFSVQKTVQIKKSDMNIRLDSVLLDEKPYRIEIEGNVGNQKVPIDPTIFTWQLENPAICSVINGTLTATTNGSTWLYGTHASDFSDSLKVNIQIPTKRYYAQTDMSYIDKFKITKSSNIGNLELSHENLPAGWKYGVNLNYTYATGRAPMIKLEQTMPLYSLPDSVSLIINTKGEIGFEKIILGMRPNHESALKSLQIEQLTPATGDIQISFGVGEITDVPNDKIAYPLWFNYMSFYLTPSTQTAGKKYSLAIKELQLCYNRITVGFPNSTLANRLVVYPNPVKNGEAYVILKLEESTNIRMEIVNLEGNIIRNQNLGIHSKEVTLPLHGLPTGTYFVKLYKNKKNDLVKIIIK